MGVTDKLGLIAPAGFAKPLGDSTRRSGRTDISRKGSMGRLND